MNALGYRSAANPKFVRLTLALAGGVIAVTGIASGGTAAMAGATSPASPRTAIALDSFTKRLTPAASRTPAQIAKSMLAAYGWSPGQFKYLFWLWNRESGWNPRAYNPSSGAYGIPQALPGGKMASAGSDWRTNPVTQMRWGLRYIRQQYGSPQAAWNHEVRHGWY
jgi:resuscitation-promoting factor RpfB